MGVLAHRFAAAVIHAQIRNPALHAKFAVIQIYYLVYIPNPSAELNPISHVSDTVRLPSLSRGACYLNLLEPQLAFAFTQRTAKRRPERAVRAKNQNREKFFILRIVPWGASFLPDVYPRSKLQA